VEARLDHDKAWATLLKFELHIEGMAHVGQYITYSNDPCDWPAGLREEARKAHMELAAVIRTASS